ncbi:MAG: hypothetical protein ACOH2Q_18440 [Rhodococcus sp. (in: high G+C Gram-positive bacteria)]
MQKTFGTALLRSRVARTVMGIAAVAAVATTGIAAATAHASPTEPTTSSQQHLGTTICDAGGAIVPATVHQETRLLDEASLPGIQHQPANSGVAPETVETKDLGPAASMAC